MTEIEILKEIINSIKENTNKPKLDNITSATNLRDNLSFDSLDLAEFTVYIEQQFGVDVFEDGIVLTIGEIVEKIKNNKT